MSAMTRRADEPKLKALHWRKLPASSASNGSVWGALAKQGLISSREDEVHELERMFVQREVVRRRAASLREGTGAETR